SPPSTPDRSDALLDARPLLRETTEAGAGDEIGFASRLALVRCHRLLRDYASALADLDVLDKRQSSPEAAEQLIAERIAVLLAQKKPRDAVQVFDTRVPSQKPLTGELSLAAAQVIAELATLAIAQSSVDAPRLERVLEQRVDQTQRDIGGYWGYRCAPILEQVRATRKYGVSVAQLVRRAASEYSRGQSDDAAKHYGEAMSAASR